MFAIKVENRHKLKWKETQSLKRKNGYALVKVKAAGVNRADILQKKGLYPPPEGVSDILGLELSGIVEDIDPFENKFQKGDKIMALVGGGAYSEYALVPGNMLISIPEGLSFNEAAAIPEAIYTSYLNLVIEGGIKKDCNVLVHSGAGGIGSTAIQLAKFYEAKVVTTTGSDEKIAFCEELGADIAVNRHHDPLIEHLRNAVPEGYDIILDTVGDEQYAAIHQEVLRKNGRWILIGLLGGGKSLIDMGIILGKNLMLKGSTLRSRSIEEKVKLTQRIKHELIPAYNSGALKPVLDKVFNIEEANQAHSYILENKVKGKVVLELPEY